MQLSTRQLCLILGGLVPLSKLILLPATLSHFVGKDLWLPPLVLFLLEGVVISLTLFLSSKTDQTFFELLSGTIGKIGAKIVFFLYGLFFLLSALLPVYEQTLFLRSAFYDTVPSPLFFLGFYVVAIYLSCQPLRCIGRLADILVPVSAVSLLILSVLSISESNFERLLPLFSTDLSTLSFTTFRAVPLFFECLYPLFFLGHFKQEKGTTKKVLLAFAIGVVFVLFFLVNFYAEYGAIASRQSSALSKIGRYFPAVDSLGRLDLILVYLASGSYFLSLMLPLYFSAKCFAKSIPIRVEYLAFFLNAFVFLLFFFFHYTISHFEKIITGFCPPIFLVFAYLLPIVALFLRRKHA